MNDEDVRRQLQSMIAFIQQEAEEKYTEIVNKARDDFALEKQRLKDTYKAKIDKEFDAKESQFELNKKIAQSTEVNTCRLRTLKAREDGIQAIVSETVQRQQQLSRPGPAYKELLVKLLVQSFLKLREVDVSVICRKEDVSLAEEALPEAIKQFKTFSGAELRAAISNKIYLSPALPSGGTSSAHSFCTGGIVVTSHGGRIVCSNTLDDRLSLVYHQRLPQIREMLFGVNSRRIWFD